MTQQFVTDLADFEEQEECNHRGNREEKKETRGWQLDQLL